MPCFMQVRCQVPQKAPRCCQQLGLQVCACDFDWSQAALCELGPAVLHVTAPAAAPAAPRPALVPRSGAGLCSWGACWWVPAEQMASHAWAGGMGVCVADAPWWECRLTVTRMLFGQENSCWGSGCLHMSISAALGSRVLSKGMPKGVRADGTGLPKPQKGSRLCSGQTGCL